MSVWKPKSNWRSRFTNLDDLLARARRAPELSESVVSHYKVDDGVLDDLLENAKRFSQVRDDAPTVDLDDIKNEEGDAVELTERQKDKLHEYMGWNDLFDDLFRSLYTYNEPEILESEQVKPSRELNRKIMSAVIENEEFRKIRPHTRHSEMDAAFTSMSMALNLQDVFKDHLRDFILRVKELEEIEDQMSEDQEGQGGGSGGGGNTPGPPGESEEDRLERLAQELAERDRQQQKQNLTNQVQQALKQTVQEGQDAAMLFGSMPGTEPGSDMRMPPNEMLKLAEKWRKSDLLREVARMAGRMRRDMYQKRARRIRGGLEENVDVKLGNDIPLLLPHELALVGHPIAKRDFQRRYYEESLLEFDTEGLEPAGRGPIVVCIDGSGSMMGEENVWARSVSLALLSIARREKRDAAVIEFSSTGQTKSWEFLRREKLKPERIMDFVTHFFGGGTSIYEGLDLARAFINTRPEFKRADIVLVTDGHSHHGTSDDLLRQEMAEKGVQIHGVSIGMEPDQNDYLKKMCDSIIGTDAIQATDEATDHLAQAIF